MLFAIKKIFKNSKILFSLVSTAIFFTLILIFIPVQYQTIDDYWMAMMVGGAWGEYSPFISNINIVYGFLLSFLYKVYPLPWYPLLLILSLYLSVSAITFAISDRFNSCMIGCFVSILLLSIIFPDNFQFTFVAYLSIIAGLVLWVNSINSKRQEVAAVFFILNAGMIRGECLYTALIFVLLLLCIDFFIGKKNPEESLNLKKRFWSIIGVFILSIILYQLNNCIYNTGEYGLRERVAATDYIRIPADKINDICLQAKWNEIDYMLLISYNFDDKIFTKDKLINLISAKRQYLLDKKEFKTHMESTIKRFRLSTGNIVFLLFALCIVTGFLKKETIPYSMILLIIPILLVFLFCYLGRGLTRVTIPQYMTSIILAVLIYGFFEKNFLDKIKNNVNRYVKIVMITTIVVIITFVCAHMCLKSDFYKTSRYTDYRELLSYINLHKENFYIYDSFSYVNKSYGIFERPVFNQFENCVPSGEWWCDFPINKKIKRNHGIDNIFTALCEKKNVFYVIAERSDDRRSEFPWSSDQVAALIALFLKEHYNLDVIPEKIETFGGKDKNIYAVFKYKLKYEE